MLLKFELMDGKIKFYTHNVEWTIVQKIMTQDGGTADKAVILNRDHLSEESKDLQLANLDARGLTYSVTDYEVPSADLLAKCETKEFTSYDEALAFVEAGGVSPKSQLEIIQETLDALVIASLEG